MTLALAILGATLGVLNTSMAIWQWKRSGPRVTVTLRAGWQVAGNGIASYTADSFDQQPRPQTAIQAVVIVHVTNSGRSPVDVSEWWINVGTGQLGMTSRIDPAVVKMLDPMWVTSNLDDILLLEHNEPCPFRLDSHASKSWVLSMASVADALGALNAQTPLVSATVQLGNGKVASAKQRVTPTQLGIAGLA
jgi:hypothetical protein